MEDRIERELDLFTRLPVPDSDDEYVRQATERHLLSLGYDSTMVQVDKSRQVPTKCDPMLVNADLWVSINNRPAMIIRCARGSLVSREYEVLAAARLLSDPWIPLAVVSNGEDAHILDVKTGKVKATGLSAIPTPQELADILAEHPGHHPTPKELKQATCVYSAFSFIQCPGVCRV